MISKFLVRNIAPISDFFSGGVAGESVLVRKYKPKNRYCKRTKLSEAAFLAILSSYIDGFNATDTHSLLINTKGVDVTISRQAVEAIYLRLGNYLWDKFVKAKMRVLYEKYELDDECESFEHFIVYYLDMMRQAIEGDVDYKSYRKDGIEIGSMGAVKLLQDRSIKFNGLPAKTFHCHFAYASFIATMKHQAQSTRFSLDDVKIMMVNELIREPI